MIKKLLFICMFVFASVLPSFIFAQGGQAGGEKVDVVLFSSPYCGHCKKCLSEFIPDFIEQNKDRINFVHYNIFEDEGNSVFYDAVNEYGIEDSGVPAMVVGDAFLMGYPAQIKDSAQTAVDAAIAQGKKTRVKPVAAQIAQAPAQADSSSGAQQPTSAKSIFEQITLWAIIGAGLVDGINPCAFAVIVFFISFLSVYQYTKREILTVGICYCASVFAAYVLIGLGLFNFLYAMKSFYYVILGFKWLTVALCAVFFILSLYDLIVYAVTRKADKIILQLPKNYKEYIHKVMRFFLRDKNKSVLRLAIASVAVGFIVSLVEAICTGQVYLPTIALILKEADSDFWLAVIYLLLYNLMFIVPLVIVFALTLLGYESKGFNDFLKKHLALTKFLLALVFLMLLLLLIGSVI